MRARAKRLLAMTGVLVASAAGFAAWETLSGRTRVTVVNRTGRPFKDVRVGFEGGKIWVVDLAPGASASSVVYPGRPGAAEPGMEGMFGVHSSEGGVGFRPVRWVRVEFRDAPPGAVGWKSEIAADHGRTAEWWQIWLGIKTMSDPFRGGAAARYNY